MAFYVRFLFVVMALVTAPLYAPDISAHAKIVLVSVGIAIAVTSFIWVSVFAWFKPEHLLYGAESHFEKWRIGLGSDRGVATHLELRNPVSNPDQPGQPGH